MREKETETSEGEREREKQESKHTEVRGRERETRGGEREGRRNRFKFPPKRDFLSLFFSLFCDFSFSFLFFHFTFQFFNICKYNYLDGPDYLRFPKSLEDRLSPRFMGSHYLMFLYQIVTSGS